MLKLHFFSLLAKKFQATFPPPRRASQRLETPSVSPNAKSTPARALIGWVISTVFSLASLSVRSHPLADKAPQKHVAWRRGRFPKRGHGDRQNKYIYAFVTRETGLFWSNGAIAFCLICSRLWDMKGSTGPSPTVVLSLAFWQQV